MLRIFGHWQLPLICAVVWWGMLIAMLIVWSANGRPNYKTGEKGVLLVYISDVGGYVLKALFIPCAAVQGVFFTLSLAAGRYLRHAGRLPPNMRRREKVFAGIAIFLSIPGQIGILLVAVFDVVHHNKTHHDMLLLFICCIGASVLFTILEIFYLDSSYPEIRRLRVSYIFKICFLVVAVILAIGFGVCSLKKKRVTAAVFEWFLAFWYGLYLLSLAYDLFPAFRKSSKADAFERQADSTISNWLGLGKSNPRSNNNQTGPTHGALPETVSSGSEHEEYLEQLEKASIGDLVYQNRTGYQNGNHINAHKHTNYPNTSSRLQNHSYHHSLDSTAGDDDYYRHQKPRNVVWAQLVICLFCIFSLSCIYWIW